MSTPEVIGSRPGVICANYGSSQFVIETVDYVILAGGSGSRLGADKAGVRVCGVSMIDWLIRSLPNAPIVIGAEVSGGPVAALAAACDVVSKTWVGLVAVDMPFAGPVLGHLRTMVTPAIIDGIVPVDAQGRTQWLIGLYRTESLRRAIGSMGEIHGQSMRRMTEFLDLETVILPDAFEPFLMDIDTPADLATAQVLGVSIDPT